LDGVVFEYVGGVESQLLQIGQLVQHVERDEKNQETAQAIAERPQQLAQQVAIEQSHWIGRLEEAPVGGQKKVWRTGLAPCVFGICACSACWKPHSWPRSSG